MRLLGSTYPYLVELQRSQITMTEGISLSEIVGKVTLEAAVNSFKNRGHAGITLSIVFRNRTDDAEIVKIDLFHMYDRAPSWLSDYAIDMKALLNVDDHMGYVNQCIAQALCGEAKLEILSDGTLLLQVGTFTTEAEMADAIVDELLVIP